MKRIGILTLTALAVLSIYSPCHAELSAYDIAEKAYYIEDGDDVKSLIVMTIVEPDNSQRVRYLAFGRKDYGKDNRSLIMFRKPADVKGTSFLTWNYADRDDNDQWLYLPALKRVKRISTASKSKSFMGSDFSYEDMSKRSLTKDTFKRIGEESIDSQDCYILESLAKDKSEKYIKRIAWIRKDNFLTVKTDYYDASGTLCKQFTATDIRNIQGIPTVHFLRMKNLKNQGYSTMKLDKIIYNTGLPERMFLVQGLKK